MILSNSFYQVKIDKNSKLDDIVYNARISNINTISLIINAPISDIDFPYDGSISIDEFNNIINKINQVKLNNPDIQIFTGIVSTYDKTKTSYLGYLKNKVDSLILRVDSVEVNTFIKEFNDAIDSGLFDSFIQIEDIFNYRDTLNIEDRKKYDEELNTIYKSICLKLNEYRIPIEIDINNTPSSANTFLRTLSYYETRVIPVKRDINSNTKDYFKVLPLKYISKYNPILERIQNQKLNYICNKNLVNSYTIYTERGKKLLKVILKRIPKESDRNLIEYYILDNLDSSIKLDSEKSNYLDKGELNNISSIMMMDISNEEKHIKLEESKDRIKQINQVFEKRITLINNIKENVKYAFQVGANGEEDILEIVTLLTEIKYTSNESLKRILIDNLSEIESRLRQGNSNSEVSKLVKKNPVYNNESNIESSSFMWNDGKINIFFIILILSFIIGFGIGIAYMLIKIN